jgi:hypothetical protein
MSNLNWDDIQITPQEFINIFTAAAKDSSYFNDQWDKPWHPEDLFYNMEAVLEGMGNGLRGYLGLIGNKVRMRELNEQFESRWGQHENRTQVFGGTIPTSSLGDDSPAPSYARNTAFGDNV